jgi:hypothetical protein
MDSPHFPRSQSVERLIRDHNLEADMTVKVIGLDIAKNVFQVHGVNEAGEVVLRRRLRRSDVLRLFKEIEAAIVGIEACHTAHYWARELIALGHDVRLMPPQEEPEVRDPKPAVQSMVRLGCITH